MKVFQFKYDGEISLKKRSNGSMIINVVISILIGIAISYKFDWGLGIIIGGLIFVVQYIKSSRWERYLITLLIIDDNFVTIEYYDESKKISLKERKQYFDFKVETALNKTPTYYLAIYKEKELLIKQFVIGEWTEEKFREVIKAFKP